MCVGFNASRKRPLYAIRPGASGDISLQNVRATINPGYKSNQILLGMSFLKHLEFSQRGDTLTLRQYPDDL